MLVLLLGMVAFVHAAPSTPLLSPIVLSTTKTSRDVRVKDYTYRQFSDGSIQVLQAPSSGQFLIKRTTGKRLTKQHDWNLWQSITNEIGEWAEYQKQQIQYRDVDAEAGYLYRQFSDDSIQVMKAPSSGLFLVKQTSQQKITQRNSPLLWQKITNEIGLWSSYQKTEEPPKKTGAEKRNENTKIEKRSASSVKSVDRRFQKEKDGMLGKVHLRLDVGGKFNHWYAADIPQTQLQIDPFWMVYYDMRLKLGESFTIERFRYETTIGSDPSQVSVNVDGNTSGASVKNISNGLKASLLDTVIGIYFPSLGRAVMPLPIQLRTKGSGTKYIIMEKIGVGGRVKYQSYESTIDLDQGKYVMTSSTDPDTSLNDLFYEEGTKFLFPIRILKVDAGLIYTNNNSQDLESGIIGLSYLKFQKPWSMPGIDSQLEDSGMLFVSTFSAFGVGQHLQKRSASGFVLDTSMFVGAGSIELAEGIELGDLLAEASNGELGVLALVGGMDVGWDFRFVRKRFSLSLSAVVGFDGDYFMITQNNENQDLLDAENPPLTYDLRTHGLLRLQANF